MRRYASGGLINEPRLIIGEAAIKPLLGIFEELTVLINIG